MPGTLRAAREAELAALQAAWAARLAAAREAGSADAWASASAWAEAARAAASAAGDAASASAWAERAASASEWAAYHHAEAHGNDPDAAKAAEKKWQVSRMVQVLEVISRGEDPWQS
jgi:hypothetical protein